MSAAAAHSTAAAAPLAWASKFGADGERPVGRVANDNEGLIIDLFAGGGGASEGVFEATGRHPDVGVNHDRDAISMHEVNHPTTHHVCEDIRKVDIPALLALPRFAGRLVDFLWASPDCKDHSKAKGGTPKDKNIRGLAWEVLRWCAAIKRITGRLPSCVVIENVEEFVEWGPLHRYGKKAGKVNKRRRRELFNLFISQFRGLGFTAVEWRELVAADFDTPTTRKRVFIVLRSDGGAIRWPEPTNTKVVETGDLFAAQVRAWRPAAEIIDWTIDIPSIFGRRRPLKAKTHARLARGIKRFVIEAAEPFIVPVTNTKWGGDRIRPTSQPLKTATTAKGGEFAFAAPTIMPVTHGGAIDRSYSPMAALPAVTGAHRGELTLCSAFLKPRYGEREGQEPRVRSMQVPAPATVPTGNGGDLAAVFLHRQFGTSVSGRPITAPHPAVMADGGGGKSHLVAVHLSSIAYGDGWARPGDRAFAVTSPIGVVTGSNDKIIVAAHLLRVDHTSGVAERKGVHAATDTLRTMSSAGGFALAGISLLRFTKGSVGSDLRGPMLTPVSHSKDALLAVYMDQHNGDRVGREAGAPLTTLAHRATQQKLAVAVIDKYYGSGVAHGLNQPFGAATAKARFSISSAFLEQANTGMVGHDLRKPVSTIVGGGADSGWGTTQRLVDVRLEALCEEIGAPAGSRRRDVLEFLWLHFGAPTKAEWEAPLATAQARLRFGLVVIEGVAYAIVDIGMRMLVPRELYRAQGFRDHYIIDRTADGRPLSKTAQTRMAGNSVCPRVAKAIAQCNAPRRILLPERLAA